MPTLTALVTGLFLGPASAQNAVPALNALPQGGRVVAGEAVVQQSGNTLTVQQSGSHAAIDWRSFDVGGEARVDFVQPSASSVMLNRVVDGQASQIFGRVTANGQVFLSNPAGIYFAPGASVEVGGLVATTHRIGLEDFLAGHYRFVRHRASGSVVNAGELKSALGGYIALLAPEVRNQGVILASLGTVALAAGGNFELRFDDHHLAELRVESSTIRALVENSQAVLAPGGLIILSAQAADRLQSGVVRNSGRLEATGLSRQGGRLVLESSGSLLNTGEISADASAAGPAGQLGMTARTVVNEGRLSARGSESGGAGGQVGILAGTLDQAAGGVIDVSAPQQGGRVVIGTSGLVNLAGRIDVSATREPVVSPPVDAGAIKGGSERSGDEAPISPTTGIRPTIPTTTTPLIVPPGTVNVAPKAAELPAVPVSTTSAGGEVAIRAAGIRLEGVTLEASGARGGRVALDARAPVEAAPRPEVSDLPDAEQIGRIVGDEGSMILAQGRQGAGGKVSLQARRIGLQGSDQLRVDGTSEAGQLLIEETVEPAPVQVQVLATPTTPTASQPDAPSPVPVSARRPSGLLK